jgi:hypothetical protein
LKHFEYDLIDHQDISIEIQLDAYLAMIKFEKCAGNSFEALEELSKGLDNTVSLKGKKRKIQKL